MPATGSVAQRWRAVAWSALASSSPAMSTSVPRQRSPARCTRRSGRAGLVGLFARVELSFVRGGGRSGPQVPRRGTCKGACPGEAAPTTPRPGFNDAFNDAPGGPPNRAIGPHSAGRTRPAASATGAAQGTATTADLPAAIGFRRSRQPGGAKPRWHGPERAPSPAGCAVGRTVGHRPASARAARTRLVRPVLLIPGFRPAALLRDRHPATQVDVRLDLAGFNDAHVTVRGFNDAFDAVVDHHTRQRRSTRLTPRKLTDTSTTRR